MSPLKNSHHLYSFGVIARQSSRVILVVEDEPLFRELVCAALDNAGFTSVPAGTATDAVKLSHLNDPDGAIIDIDLGGGPNGLVLAARLRKEMPHLALVFLTAFTDPRSVLGPAIPEDARFVQKSLVKDVSHLNAVMDEAMRGLPIVTRHLTDATNPLAVLTNKQVDVLRMMAEGLTNEQIAEVRGTTVRAVEMLVRNLFRRVGPDEGGSGKRRALASRLLAKK